MGSFCSSCSSRSVDIDVRFSDSITEEEYGTEGKCKNGLRKLTKYHNKYKSITQMPYYHGRLPRKDIEKDNLLVDDGDFLVRESEHNDEPLIVTVNQGGANHHVPFGYINARGQWTLGSKSFTEAKDVIMYHVKNREPVGKVRAVLRYPVPKDEYQLQNDDVKLIRVLGSGQFGEVHLAILTLGRQKRQEVAVKVMNNASLEQLDKKSRDIEKEKFLEEARLMKRYKHENVVRFIGICIMRDPIMVVMELVPGGSLDKYLRDHGVTVSLTQLFFFCLDAAEGMWYLSDRNCIHRDLAARNCLLTSDLRCKISDFGMSRLGDEYKLHTFNKLPLKWTAPEVFSEYTYTHASDVWSYGVLMWEVYNEGKPPYGDMKGNDIVKFLHKGKRLNPGSKMPRSMAGLMEMCFNLKPHGRPSFRQLVESMKHIQKEKGYFI